MKSAQAEGVTTGGNEIKFKDDLRTVADKAKELMRLHVDATTGVIAIPAGKSLELVEDGPDEDTVKKVHETEDLLTNAFTLAGSELGVEILAKNKDLKEVTVHAPILKKVTYEGTFKRTGTSRNVKTGEVSNYVGSIGTGRLNVVSTRTQAEWQAIKQNMRSMAEAAGL